MTEEQLEEIKIKMQVLKNEIETKIEEKNIEDTKIVDIVYLGKVNYKTEEEGKIEEKEIFMCIQEQDGKFVYKYYDENNELIALENVTDDNVIPSKKYLYDDKGIVDKVGKLDKEGIASLNELEQEKEKNNKQSEEEKEEKQQEGEDNEKIEKSLEKDTTSNLTKKERINLNQIIKGETLSNKLGIPPEYTELVLVSASQVNAFFPSNKKHRNKDAFIAIRPDGEGMVIGEDILEFDEHSGTNPTNESLTINKDGRVQDEQSTSRWKIVNGNNREYISVSYDENFGKEVKYTQWSPEQNKYVDFELETNKTREKNQDVNKFIKERSGINSVNRIIENNEKEGKCPKKDVTMVDDNPNNDSHTYDVSYAVKQIMKNETISNAYGDEYVAEYVEKKIKETDMSIEEIIEYITDDLERVAKSIERK